MAAAPFPGYNMVVMEPAMGFHQGCRPRVMLAPVGVRLPAGFHPFQAVQPLAVAGSAGGVRAVAATATGFYIVALPPAAGSLMATTAYFGAGADERASRGARFVSAAAGHGDGPVALGLAGVVAGTAGSGGFRGMSVVAKAGGDGPTSPDDSDVNKDDGLTDPDDSEYYYYYPKRPTDPVLVEIREFEPDIHMPASEIFTICRDKDMLLMFQNKMIVCYWAVLETALDFRASTPMNREALIQIGKDFKMVALECEKGFLGAVTLDRAVASLKRPRATWLGCGEDNLEPLVTSIPTPLPPTEEDQVNNYFVYMKYYLDEVMKEVVLFVARQANR